MLVQTLRKRFYWDESIILLPFAVCNRAGPVALYNFKESAAFNALSAEWAECMGSAERNHLGLSLKQPSKIQVQGITVSQLTRECSPVKFVKIDIEGGEADALSTLDIPVRLISLEFNFRTFRSQLEVCKVR